MKLFETLVNLRLGHVEFRILRLEEKDKVGPTFMIVFEVPDSPPGSPPLSFGRVGPQGKISGDI